VSNSFAEKVTNYTLDIDLSKKGSTTNSITTLCTDIFVIVIRMRESEDLGEPAALRKLILHYIRQFEKNCKSMRIPYKMISDAIYALVALLDETVMSVPGASRNYWVTSPLQLKLFGDDIAGEEFYRRLEKLSKDPQRKRDVIEIYYLCLSLGFEGKYKLGNTDQRDMIIDKTARMLLKVNRRKLSGLSPHGKRVISQAYRKGHGIIIPYWITAIAAVFFLITWWFGLHVLANESLHEVLSIINN
jgi:type VI secretion system protein ImpK